MSIDTNAGKRPTCWDRIAADFATDEASNWRFLQCRIANLTAAQQRRSVCERRSNPDRSCQDRGLHRHCRTWIRSKATTPRKSPGSNTQSFPASSHASAARSRWQRPNARWTTSGSRRQALRLADWSGCSAHRAERRLVQHL